MHSKTTVVSICSVWRETQTDRTNVASSKPFVHIITANTSKRQIKDKKEEEDTMCQRRNQSRKHL